MTCDDALGRAVSPVVGVTLLVAIVVMLAATATWVFLGVSESPEPTPDAVLDVESGEGGAEYRLVHAGGDRVDGADLEFRGALDADAAAGAELSNGDNVSFYPIAEEVTVVWHGEEGRTYALETIEVERALPAPDEGCEWVDDESDGGTEKIDIDGDVVNCDATTDKEIEIDDGTLVGDAESDNNELDVNAGTVFGDVDVEDVVNVQDGTITGETRSRTADVKLANATVEGSIEAHKVAEAIDGSAVEGDVVSVTKSSKIDDSRVEGSVTADGTVDLDDATVEGDVYADPGDFECTNSTVDGEDCGAYTPKDPDDW